MQYNISFSILSSIYLFITAFFYKRQLRVAGRRSALFDAMLKCGILSLLLDIAAAVLDPYAYLWPSWIVYTINIVFLLSTQLSGLLFFLYSINLTGTYSRMSRPVRRLIFLPFIAIALLIILSPFSQSAVFFLDENHVYHHGTAHMALYAVMALYLITSFLIVFVRRKQLTKLKFYTIVSFLCVTVIAMLIQMNHPYLLVNNTATAFALTLIYYILEAPSSHVDALTGVFNRTALSPVIRDIYEEGERCTLLMYALNTLHILNNSLGMKGGDEAIIAFAQYLQKAYPGCSVFRTEGDIFSVLVRGGKYIDINELRLMNARTKDAFMLSTGRIVLGTSLSCINSEDCATAKEMLGLLESLMRQNRAEGLRGMLLADADFKANIIRRTEIETATRRAMDENRVEVHYQPIHDSSGRLCALEALVRITDPVLGPLPTQELVELAEQNGSILRLGEQVLRTTCAFLRDNNVSSWGLDHVGVNLSAVQCVQGGLPKRVNDMLTEYGLPKGLISFEITETAAGALQTVRKNMEQLVENGAYFLLDDFGTGYANFRNIAALPYHCIKLDKSLLWNAHDSEKRMQLLCGVVKVVCTMGLTCLCEGVETKEQADLLISLGVSMLQGYYFSRPLSPQALLAYGKKAGVC